MQGAGWKIIDLGTDVTADKFVKAINENQDALVGMSALLTTTMVNMEGILKEIRANKPDTKVYIGGAPVSQTFCDSIGADGYFADPFTFAKSI